MSTTSPAASLFVRLPHPGADFFEDSSSGEEEAVFDLACERLESILTVRFPGVAITVEPPDDESDSGEVDALDQKMRATVQEWLDVAYVATWLPAVANDATVA